MFHNDGSLCLKKAKNGLLLAGCLVGIWISPGSWSKEAESWGCQISSTGISHLPVWSERKYSCRGKWYRQASLSCWGCQKKEECRQKCQKKAEYSQDCMLLKPWNLTKPYHASRCHMGPNIDLCLHVVASYHFTAIGKMARGLSLPLSHLYTIISQKLHSTHESQTQS